jgi:hypothetical protein
MSWKDSDWHGKNVGEQGKLRRSSGTGLGVELLTVLQPRRGESRQGFRRERRDMETASQLRIAKWDHRHWAVYDGEELVCVTLYKVGALEVKRRLERITAAGLEPIPGSSLLDPKSESAASPRPPVII